MKINKFLYLTSILFLFLLKNLFIFVIITSFNTIQSEYGLSNTQLGTITSLYYLFGLIGSIIWTIIYGRLKNKTILGIGGLFWLSGLILLLFNEQYFLLLFSISLIGIGLETIPIICLNLYTEVINPKKSGILISLFFIFQGLGGILGIIITGILEGLYNFSWRQIVGIISLLLFILLLLILFRINNFSKDNSISKKISEIEGSETLIFQTIEETISFSIIKEIFSNKINFLIFLTFFIFTPFNHFNNVWLQKYLIEEHNLNQTMASISIIFTSGGEFMGLLLGGLLLDKLKINSTKKKAKFGSVCFFISAPLFFIAYFLNWSMNSMITNGMNFIDICWYMFQSAIGEPAIFSSYTTLFFGFIINQMAGPLFLNIIIENNPKRLRNLAINLIIIILNVGQVVGPILGGYIGDNFNLKISLLTIPLVYFICSLLYLILAISQKKEER